MLQLGPESEGHPGKNLWQNWIFDSLKAYECALINCTANKVAVYNEYAADFLSELGERA